MLRSLTDLIYPPSAFCFTRQKVSVDGESDCVVTLMTSENKLCRKAH